MSLKLQASRLFIRYSKYLTYGVVIIAMMMLFIYITNDLNDPVISEIQLHHLTGTNDMNFTCYWLTHHPANDTLISKIANLKLHKPSEFLFDTKDNCERFKSYVYSNHDWISLEEKHFPIAYTMTVHDDVTQIARLLRLIYRPHNAYCLHVDKKSSDQFYNSIIRLAECLGDNVVVIERQASVSVEWGKYSLLEAHLICAREMLRFSKVIWRYLLNVSGGELPLLTNWELVSALRALNGSNMIELLGPKYNPERWPQTKFNFDFTWCKGTFYAAMTREFVNHSQTDKRALQILGAMKDEGEFMKHPDELFYPTLAYNPQLNVPGACIDPEKTKGEYLARHVIWGYGKCDSGLSVHAVCIMGIRNLPDLLIRPEFIVNKFNGDYQPIGYDCFEYTLIKRYHTEQLSHKLRSTFDVSRYANLHCSKYHM